MNITGRIFDIHIINDKSAQIVLKKKLGDKIVPVAIEVFGYWKDKALNELKLKPKDKIRGNVVLKSNLFKGKYYTDVVLKNIELIPEKIKDDKHEGELYDDDAQGFIVDEETGEVLL